MSKSKHFFLLLSMLALSCQAAPTTNASTNATTNATTHATNIDDLIFDGQFSFPAVFIGDTTWEDFPLAPGANITSSSCDDYATSHRPRPSAHCTASTSTFVDTYTDNSDPPESPNTFQVIPIEEFPHGGPRLPRFPESY
ncbi:hypothetical protein B0H19DRAFT_1262369 [Mycena capillaripes]|nr:hypothetical protein B0H19DRAFT_1262369 [Mycena capillaripes]